MKMSRRGPIQDRAAFFERLRRFRFAIAHSPREAHLARALCKQLGIRFGEFQK